MATPLHLLAVLLFLATTNLAVASSSASPLCDFYVKLNGKPSHSTPRPGFDDCASTSEAAVTATCDFHQVTCNEAGEITSWDLSFADLEGTIDDGWFFEHHKLFASLSSLNLSGNEISGSFPHDLCLLTLLTNLDLSWNSLSGEIPKKDCWSQLTLLSTLNLSQNLFSGELEDELFFANAKLTHVSFAHNARDSLDVDGRGIKQPGFSGTLPSSWPASLTTLDFSENSLHHSLSPNLCNNENLVELVLYQNFLSGVIDGCIVQLSKLRTLDLRQNQFEGNLPDFDSFYITEFLVGDNYLTGQLPSSLNNAPLLSILDVSVNYLSGDLPASFVSPHLSVLDVHDNNFTSAIPTSYANLNSLEILELSRNALIGELNHDLFNLPKIREIDVSYNSLTGTVPDTYSESLVVVDLTFNYLNGTLPESISASFREFYFGDNDITGDITDAICDLVIAGSLQEVSSCEDLACPAGYHGNDFGAPFQGGCVECLDSECQPFLAQSGCPEDCQKNWTEVFDNNEADTGASAPHDGAAGNSAAIGGGGE